MTMTYQQEFVLNGVAGRAAILNLTARHNRLFSAGDLAGWIATFRHAGATLHPRGGDVHRPERGLRRWKGTAAGHRRPRDLGRRRRCHPETVSRCCSSEPNFVPPGPTSDRLIYERGGWYFTSRELEWDVVPSKDALPV